MDMSGWLTVAPRLESVNGPAAFLPCCKKFKLMWHSGHVAARHAQWFMPLISSRGHFKWKHREFANFTVRHCRGKSTTLVYLERFSALLGGKAQAPERCICQERAHRLPVGIHWLWSKADCHTNKTESTKENLCYHHLNRLWLDSQSNTGHDAEGGLQSGLLVEYSKHLPIVCNTYIHIYIHSKKGRTHNTFGTLAFREDS